jgi:acyl-CoA synthetase (AMP-forming)/AMP-acid ligase II
MLYDRWLQIARSCRSQIALRDLATGSEWTFAELAAVGEKAVHEPGPVSFPSGASADFIFAVLQAWRRTCVVCPLESGQPPPNLTDTLPPDIVHLKTTSATTGTPRLIAFTAPQLIADAQNIVLTMGLRPDWPNLGVVSLAHSYGFSNLVLPLLLHGIPLILVGSSLPESLRRAAAAERDLTLAAVPALWRLWHDANAIPSNIRLGISAGAPLPLTAEHAIFGGRGLKLHNFYGSSECGGIAYDASSGVRMESSCVGAAMRNVQCSVAADGCLEVCSNAVGQTYWPEPSPNLSAGVFHTSDLAEISYDLIYLRGRATDQINIAGRKVLPETIEKALLAHPEVRGALVFGVPAHDSERGEKIVACAEVTGDITSESLKQFLLTKLPAWQLPRDWWLVDSLQPNKRGKLSRADWRNRYLSERESSGR